MLNKKIKTEWLSILHSQKNKPYSHVRFYENGLFSATGLLLNHVSIKYPDMKIQSLLQKTDDCEYVNNYWRQKEVEEMLFKHELDKEWASCCITKNILIQLEINLNSARDLEDIETSGANFQEIINFLNNNKI